MEDEVSCDDPQFMNMLETCLRVEIETARNTISERFLYENDLLKFVQALESEIKEFKVKMRTQLQMRKELKEHTETTEENILIFSATLNKETKSMNEISNKTELMKLNLDSDYKIMKLECEQYKNIYKEYEETWHRYRDKYEEFSLARDRKDAKIKLEKLRIDKMVLQCKINDFEKISRQKQRIAWLMMRAKIVDFARVISNNTRLEKKLKDLNQSIKDRKEELIAIKAELSVRLKRQEEEKRDRALKLLQMPPPKINFPHMHTIYERRPRTGFLDGWKRNYENSIDSLSVDTLMLEEMCQAEGHSAQPPSEIRTPVEEDENLASDQPIDPKSPSLVQEQRQVEHEDTGSEVDGNTASDPIDAAEEEVEHRMDQELEHMDQPSSISKDKQTGQHCEEPAEEMDDPVAKRMRLIHDEEAPVASPVKSILLERKKSHLSVHPSPRPKMLKIETVRYNLPSIKKLEKIGPRRSQVVNQSPGSKISKTPSMKKLDQDDPNPSSMFTPHRYDYSDHSELSFYVNNMTELKADQISLYGGSVRDLCECSEVSTPNENPAPESNANAPSTSRTRNFPQFDFSNILKHSSGRKNLF